MSILRGMQGAAISMALLLLLGLAGCGSGSEQGATDREGSVTTTFQLDLSSILDNINVNQNQQAAAAVPSEVTASGELMIVPFNGTPLPVFPFKVSLQPGSLILTTDLKVNLDPALYTFYMLLNLSVNKVQGRYAGLAPVLIVDGGVNTVRMTLNPLLVSYNIDSVSDLLNMSSAVIDFPKDIATYTDPRFGITINGGDEFVFTINKLVSKESRKVMVYLPPGSYQIDYCFYNGELKGYCSIDQNTELPGTGNPPTNLPGEEPIAEVTYSYQEATSTATFYVPTPLQIQNELEATDELRILFHVVGASIPTYEKVLPDAVAPAGDEWKAVVSNFTRSDVTWSLSFYKVNTVDNTIQQIGYCAESDNLKDLIEKSMVCALTVQHGTIQTLDPERSVVITVYDTTNNVPVTGAVVTVNGDEVGITDDQGSLEVFLTSTGTGSTNTYDYQFQATAQGTSSSDPVTYSLTYSSSAQQVTLNVVGADTTSPGSVSGLTAVAENAKVTLTWANPTDSDFAGVRVIRSESPGAVDPTSGSQPQWNLGSTVITLADNTALNGTTYYYWVFARDAAGNFAPGVMAFATPQAPPVPPPPTVDKLVLNPARSVRPREYMDAEADLSFLGDNQAVTVEIPTLEDITVLEGSSEHFLLVLYLGDVKCMYLGGTRDRHLGGMLVEWEEVFEKAFKSPACHWGDDDESRTHGHKRRDGRISEGTVTTDGPIRARVVTGHPRHPITSIEVRIPVVGITEKK